MSRCLLLAVLVSGCGSRSGLLGGDAPAAQIRELGPDAPLPEIELPPEAEPEPEPIGCVDITHSYNSVPATVMLLIDQSGSMDEDFGFGTRWSVLRDAIVNPEDGLLGWLDESASVGLMFYSSLDGFAFGRTCPLLSGVSATFGNAASIREAYTRTEPLFNGDTPTAEGIDAAVDALLAVNDGTPKYVLLLTDGVPDTCAVPDPQRGMQEAVDAAQSAFERGVRVYTVGVSPDITPFGLQWMANAGAGKPARSLEYGRDAEAEEPLYASTDPRQLARQLKGVIGDVRSCEIELDEVIGAARAAEGDLVLDGDPLDYGAPDGWTFLDDDTLKVHGASCERILGDGERLVVRFPCLGPSLIR